MSRRNAVILSVLVIAVFIQFIQPPLNKSGSKDNSLDISRQFPVPARVQAILENSCYDCHSNNTRYPWYAKIQPGAWLLASHIRKAKADLNFNEFGRYSRRQQRSKLKGIASNVRDGTMPLRSYTWLHKDAILSDEDKQLIIEWAGNTTDSLKLNKQ